MIIHNLPKYRIDQQVPVIPKIVLAKGIPTALQPVSIIAQDVDANTGSYTWNVPVDIAPGEDYALTLGNSPNVSYSGHFTIKNDGSAAANTAIPAASDAAASAMGPAPVADATAPVAANVAVAESAGFKVSSNKAVVGAVAVAGAAAAALV